MKAALVISRATPVERPDESGFTLMELMVVIVLIVILTGIAIPGFRRAVFREESRKDLDLFVARLEQLREPRESGMELRFIDAFSRLELRPAGAEKGEAEEIPESIRIRGVYGPGGDLPEREWIGFHPKGHVDPTVIHLWTGDRDWTLVLRPFFSRVDRLPGHVMPEGWQDAR